MDIRKKLIDIKNVTFEYFRRDAEGNVQDMVEALKDVSLEVLLSSVFLVGICWFVGSIFFFFFFFLLFFCC